MLRHVLVPERGTSSPWPFAFHFVSSAVDEVDGLDEESPGTGGWVEDLDKSRSVVRPRGS